MFSVIGPFFYFEINNHNCVIKVVQIYFLDSLSAFHKPATFFQGLLVDIGSLGAA